MGIDIENRKRWSREYYAKHIESKRRYAREYYDRTRKTVSRKDKKKRMAYSILAQRYTKVGRFKTNKRNFENAIKYLCGKDFNISVVRNFFVVELDKEKVFESERESGIIKFCGYIRYVNKH